MNTNNNRLLIAGWFSFDLPHNTAGDLLAQQSVQMWATKAGYTCEVAVPRPFAENEVATDTVNPTRYGFVVFVCGPLAYDYVVPFMKQFNDCKRIAINVTILPTVDVADEFDVIIPRDSFDVSNPDISLVSYSKPVPVIGLIYVGKQEEYPTQQHPAVEELVATVIKKLGIATILIDTRLPYNHYGLSSISQVESVIQHMDAVITTRLHGAILSLRNGISAIAIDSVPGGAKVMEQMRVLGWPLSYTIDAITEEHLEEAITIALTKESSDLALRRIHRAISKLQEVEALFIGALKLNE